ncbi:MAG: ankyrin repeat domain-containing protein [Oscillochloridaceae bacterium umkhey_bin13]
MRTLQAILQATSDALFPADMGRREVFIDSRSSDGDTPLHVMLWREDHRAVAILIEAGADVNAVGDMGLTPLHVAVRKRMPEAITLLLQAGANPDLRSEFGTTAREEGMVVGGAVAKALGKTGSRNPR